MELNNRKDVNDFDKRGKLAAVVKINEIPQ